MLGVGRYRLGGNFIAFFNLRDDKGQGHGDDLHCDPLGSPGTVLVGLTEKAWNQTLRHLTLPGLKTGDEQHTTPALGR